MPCIPRNQRARHVAPCRRSASQLWRIRYFTVGQLCNVQKVQDPTCGKASIGAAVVSAPMAPLQSSIAQWPICVRCCARNASIPVRQPRPTTKPGLTGVTHAKGEWRMDGYVGKSAVERCEACRVIEEGCSRAMAACVDMIDAVSAIGVRSGLHSVPDTLPRLHSAAAATHDEATRTRMN